MTSETDELQEILETYNVRPNVLEPGLQRFSDAAKDAVVARIARAPEPPLARVLARLPLIRTPRNETDMAAIFHAGLAAPDAEARKFSVYGLQALGRPEATDAAIAALQDPDDQVVVAGASVLLPAAEHDPQVAEALRDAHAARAGREEFRTSTELIAARLIEPPEPA